MISDGEVMTVLSYVKSSSLHSLGSSGMFFGGILETFGKIKGEFHLKLTVLVNIWGRQFWKKYGFFPVQIENLGEKYGVFFLERNNSVLFFSAKVEKKYR